MLLKTGNLLLTVLFSPAKPSVCFSQLSSSEKQTISGSGTRNLAEKPARLPVAFRACDSYVCGKRKSPPAWEAASHSKFLVSRKLRHRRSIPPRHHPPTEAYPSWQIRWGYTPQPVDPSQTLLPRKDSSDDDTHCQDGPLPLCGAGAPRRAPKRAARRAAAKSIHSSQPTAQSPVTQAVSK